LHVDVRPQSYVVSEIPAVVVGIFVDDNVVAVPEPVTAIGEVERPHAEVETPEPETVGAASGEMPDVSAAEASGEVAVFPGMVEMHARIVTAGAMAHPFPVGVDVRRVGVSGLVVEVRRCRGRMRSRLGTMGRDVSGAATHRGAMLGRSYDAEQKAECEKSDYFFHGSSFSERPVGGDCIVGRRVEAIWITVVSG
jgi:hypothetical protein